MSALEEKRIIIKLPNLRWSSFLNIRVFFGLALLLFCAAFTYWYQTVRPYFWISSAHLDAVCSVVNSDITGKIVEMGPQEGDAVKKGQVLFTLDRDVLLAKHAQAKQLYDSLNVQIEIEKDRLGKAMEAYLTASSELELGIGSPDLVKKQLTMMDDAQAKSESAASQLSAAKTDLGLLDLQMKKMTLTAPFNGVILKRSKNPGAVVSFGDPVYILCDPERIWVDAEVPEDVLGNISLGTPARIRLSAYPNREFSGKITYIGPATVAKTSLLPFSGQSETVPIKVSIENPGFALKPGLSASIGLKVH